LISIKNSFTQTVRSVPLNVAVPKPEADITVDGRPDLPNYVETINWKFPNLNVYSTGDEYTDIVFPHSQIINKAVLDQYRLHYAKLLYIKRSFEQANLMQQEATGYHTISDTTTLIQKDVYRMKYDDAIEYAIRYEQAQSVNGDVSEVYVPELLANESSLVNQDPYELAISIISNYNASDSSLRSYFGKIEGIRRLLKRRILAAETLDQLKIIEWADWPIYEPTALVDMEG
jgi:hypothetical protein